MRMPLHELSTSSVVKEYLTTESCQQVRFERSSPLYLLINSPHSKLPASYGDKKIPRSLSIVERLAGVASVEMSGRSPKP